MRKDHRSECVINRTVEIFGDQWSLLIIRDIIFMNRRHFRELLTKSMEGIASNILADRLQKLVEQGIIVKSRGRQPQTESHLQSHGKRHRIASSSDGDGLWGNKYLPAAGLRGLAQVLKEGGPKLRAEFMSELRETHVPKSGAKKKVRSMATASATKREPV